jgi:hypothetical protein
MQIAAGADDAHGNLTTICDQDLAKHFNWNFVLCALYFENCFVASTPRL